LIAKGIAQMGIVKKALEDGIIAICMTSSNGYVVEELTRTELKEKNRYCCGFISAKGLCMVPRTERYRQVIIVRGVVKHFEFPREDIVTSGYIKQMDKDDVIIKSGNAMDPQRRVGVLCGCVNGGEMGTLLPYILGNGINLIVPTTLNKTIPIPLDKAIAELGVSKISVDKCHGMAAGMLPLPGEVVTEIEALKALTEAEAIPIAMSGVGSGEGTVTILIQGSDLTVEKAWQLIQSVKGEPGLAEIRGECERCHVGAKETKEKYGITCSTTRIFKSRN